MIAIARVATTWESARRKVHQRAGVGELWELHLHDVPASLLLTKGPVLAEVMEGPMWPAEIREVS